MEEIVKVATSVQVPQLIGALNQVVFNSAGDGLVPPAGMTQLGKPLHLKVKTEECTVEIAVMVSKCVSALGANVPAVIEDGGAYSNEYIGCMCEAPLHLEARGKVTWMADQNIRTQHGCVDLHTAVAAEVKAGLAGLQIDLAHLWPEDHELLVNMGKQRFHEPSFKAAKACRLMEKLKWSEEFVLNNNKEVTSKVHHDQDKKNTMLGLKYAKSEAKLWEKEKASKKQAFSDEVAKKSSANAAAKLMRYTKKQKFERVLGKEAERKAAAAKETAMKWINKELGAKKDMKNAVGEQAKESASKKEVARQKRVKEKEYKAEQDKNAAVKMKILIAKASASHKKEMTEKMNEAQAKEAKQKARDELRNKNSAIRDANAKSAASQADREEKEKQEQEMAQKAAANKAMAEQKKKKSIRDKKAKEFKRNIHKLQLRLGVRDATDNVHDLVTTYSEKLAHISNGIKEAMQGKDSIEIQELGSDQ